MEEYRRQRAVVDRWAERIRSLGLSSVVLPFLELGDAFGLLIGQILLIVGPLTNNALGETVAQSATMLSDPGQLQQLRARLTEGDGEP